MWGFISGTSVKPENTNEDYATLIDAWESNNSKIITWINNSVEHSIGRELAKYETAKEVWDHLQRLFTQSNFAKQYQLENDIRALHQNNMSIQEFYSAMTDLWDQLVLTESTELKACAAYITCREQQRLVQLLMALHSDFEGLRVSILHHSPLPSVDSVVSELLVEEIRLKSYAENGIMSASNPFVLAVSSKPSSNNQNKPYTRVTFDECSFYKHKGHWKAQCPKSRQSNQLQQQSQAWKPGNQSRSNAHRPPQSNTAAVASSGPFTDPSTLAEQFQKFLSLQPQAMSASSIDYSSFASVSPSSSIAVMTADGIPMPLAGVGSVVTPHLSLPNVYHIPKITLNLAFVGQLCDSALPFNRSIFVFSSPFDLIHSDIWGPSPVATKEGCDLGGEYTSNKFCELLALDGTIHQTSYTDIPEQNSVAERKHRHIVETARSLLLSASVSSMFWGEAVLIAIGLINIIPSSHISGFSPFKKLYGYTPNYSLFRVFGCTCFVLRPHVERSKLSSRSAICVFLAYGGGKKGYHCFDPITQKLYVSRHVVFLEHIPFFSIPSTTHSLTRSDLIRIDPFSNSPDSLSSQEPTTSNVHSHVPTPLSLQPIRTNHSAGTDTLLSSTPEASSSI
ncbi:uncharacterized protein LOC111380069 [Olea europaea var. sylvestris]|uniref:uncharacterized protein LOC111380069 n=1 Tax=Olea europaea var. sylvestris TaxID=158386 RepID=UPI000C1CEA16|nr:uncharacterized protein LOC111380069 [Olea europaea var. sylvestris]